MKQTKRLLVPLVLITFLAACASATPQRVALNSLQGIRDTVTASLSVFNAGYQAGQFSEEQRTSLGILYGKYIAADTFAANALIVTTSTDTSAIVGQVTIVASDVIKFVQALKGGP